MTAPDTPDAAAREHLLDVLAELVGAGGAGRFLASPIEPGDRAFPEAWAPTPAGVALLLRRLAWHAQIDLEIRIDDRRSGAPPTERVPSTELELVEVRGATAVFALHFVGEDDVAGALAHELGVAYAVHQRLSRDKPYRAEDPPTGRADPDADLERGSVAAVYLGLGVLAANAAHQRLRALQGTSFNPLIVAPVGVSVTTGYAPMESLAFLVAAQQLVRGEAAPPPGLAGEQARAVAAWLDALAGDGARLREQLAIAADTRASERAAIEPFPEPASEDAAVPQTTAFRWQTHRGGFGALVGAAAGFGIGIGMLATAGALAVVFGGAVVGHLIGRSVRAPRCSRCATRCAVAATRCASCGAALRGDIATLSDRLDAEERLASEPDSTRGCVEP